MRYNSSMEVAHDLFDLSGVVSFCLHRYRTRGSGLLSGRDTGEEKGKSKQC
jgi:hypothetical protein